MLTIRHLHLLAFCLFLSGCIAESGTSEPLTSTPPSTKTIEEPETKSDADSATGNDADPAAGNDEGPAAGNEVAETVKTADLKKADSKPLFSVTEKKSELQLVEESATIVELKTRIAEARDFDSSVITVAPISVNRLQVSALKPGATTLNIVDEKKPVVYGRSPGDRRSSRITRMMVSRGAA